MIETIIFSRDRAMQLDLLLNSICRHDIHHSLTVTVLYNYSTLEYRQAYAQLQEKYLQFKWEEETIYPAPRHSSGFDFFYWHNLFWWLKYRNLRKNTSNFKETVLKILMESTTDWLMFLTDDSLFYRNIKIMDDKDDIDSFSLRHGANLIGGKYRKSGNCIKWNVYENDFATDWGYPFSVDGHVYPKNKLLKIIRKILFNNPNSMEGNIVCYVKDRHLFAKVAANANSCLVGFELNRVQTVVENNHLNISQEQLNRYFLAGYTLKIHFDRENAPCFRPEIKAVVVQKDKEQITVFSP
jgi:hypothetical protein